MLNRRHDSAIVPALGGRSPHGQVVAQLDPIGSAGFGGESRGNDRPRRSRPLQQFIMIRYILARRRGGRVAVERSLSKLALAELWYEGTRCGPSGFIMLAKMARSPSVRSPHCGSGRGDRAAGAGNESLDGLRALGGSTGPLLSKARSVIYIFLSGGLSQLESFDLKPEAPAEIRGEFRPIATKTPGIEICEHLPRTCRAKPTLGPGAVADAWLERSFGRSPHHADGPVGPSLGFRSQRPAARRLALDRRGCRGADRPAQQPAAGGRLARDA